LLNFYERFLKYCLRLLFITCKQWRDDEIKELGLQPTESDI
jgi:hypothetical protein